MEISSVSNIIPQTELERTSERCGGQPAVAVSGNRQGGAVGSNSCRSPTTNRGGGGGGDGGGGASSSVHTCDQVGIFEAKTLATKAEARAYYKGLLTEALRGCGRDAEALAVSHCGEDFKVGKCNDCGAMPAFPVTCDHRLCPDCSARRASLLVNGHSDILRRLHYPKMLTLTFLSVKHIDKAYIKWARGCFTKLRHRKVFKPVWGGIYSFEATYSLRYGWHLHIHSLLGSGYIEQACLAKEWQKITGACVVDIRAVRGADKWDAIKEVVKYPCKVATFIDKPELVGEFLTAAKGVSLAYGFGALYRVRSRERGGDGLRCPVCGGSDINWGAAFYVPRIGIEQVKGGYLWRAPPGVKYTYDFSSY
ncbi:hypothetical protein ES705_38999 [subsurface metagenome]